MKSAVQARLDPETQKALRQLTGELGWTTSKVVREALRLLAATHRKPSRPKVIGLGQFDSGVDDLGSNKNRLRGFGR